MKETTTITTRLIATTPEEKEVIKSWGALWSRFGELERSGEYILLIIGCWSGYESGGKGKIVHVDYAGYYPKMDNSYQSMVAFQDRTTMLVWAVLTSRKEILIEKYKRRQGYTQLITKTIKSGESFYRE